MIRSVVAFSLEANMLKCYTESLHSLSSFHKHHSVLIGCAEAISRAFPFIIYAVMFFAMGEFVALGEDPEDLLIVLCTIYISIGQIGKDASFASKIVDGRNAAKRILKLLDRESSIQDAPIKNEASQSLSSTPYFQEKLQFQNVFFAYPGRPDTSVLNGFNIEIKPGQMVALVGESGCGKSTTISLLERFYDPCTLETVGQRYQSMKGDAGVVMVDGKDLRELSLFKWRNETSIVPQEPVLFKGTIEDNIRFGRQNVTYDEVVAAAKEANAHDFIMEQQNGYDTSVGGVIAKLSGGQKQRIAIARAIVWKPRLLLLDEATSALDSESEKVVQKAIDNLLGKKKMNDDNLQSCAKDRMPMASIIIAHRLSTVKNADFIIVVDHGVVVETGTYRELMAIENGRFRALQLLQRVQ